LPHEPVEVAPSRIWTWADARAKIATVSALIGLLAFIFEIVVFAQGA
jgi:hypothetical protein